MTGGKRYEKRPVAFILLFCWSVFLWGQPDTSILSLEQFLSLVKKNHPLAQKAELLLDAGEAARLQARGGFDPKLEGFLDRKSYDDKNYFTLYGGKLKVPTWYGIEIKADYTQTGGQFLNPSDLLPAQGLWSAGISFPLARGLVIDQRRTELKKADLFLKLNEQERKLAFNELLLNAIQAYFEWQQAVALNNIFLDALDLANERYRATVVSFRQGSKPAIDTLEAFINVQTRNNELLEAGRMLQNIRNIMNNYLWINGEVPLELTDGTLPIALDNSLFQNTVDSLALIQTELLASHPEIQRYEFKIKDLEVDRQLLNELRKPELRLQFNPLFGSTEDNLFAPVALDNYKLGASFSYTLLQRKERGKLQANYIKIEQNKLDREAKRQQLSVGLQRLRENEIAYQEQLSQAEEIVQNTLRLLNAEIRKNQIGESSVFLINSRQSKYLESQIKRLDIYLKLLKNRIYYLYISGKLFEVERV